MQVRCRKWRRETVKYVLGCKNRSPDPTLILERGYTNAPNTRWVYLLTQHYLPHVFAFSRALVNDRQSLIVPANHVKKKQNCWQVIRSSKFSDSVKFEGKMKFFEIVLKAKHMENNQNLVRGASIMIIFWFCRIWGSKNIFFRSSKAKSH